MESNTGFILEKVKALEKEQIHYLKCMFIMEPFHKMAVAIQLSLLYNLIKSIGNELKSPNIMDTMSSDCNDLPIQNRTADKGNFHK